MRGYIIRIESGFSKLCHPHLHKLVEHLSMEQMRRIDPGLVGVAFNSANADSGELRAMSVTLQYWPTGNQVTVVSDPRSLQVWNTEYTARLWEQAFRLLEAQVVNP
jgi:hypothetical protein